MTDSKLGDKRRSVFDLTQWPRDPANGRLLCSPEKPMPKNAPGQWAHTNPKWLRDNYDSTVDYYRCADCEHEWESEVAQ